MLNLLRKFLRPTLREQLEAGVREALRRYADRRTAPNLRVYVSTDLVPEGMEPALYARDEADHLRRFALQWAEDNNIARTGLRLEVILLDTKREFAFVKPIVTEPKPAETAVAGPAARSAPIAPSRPIVAPASGGGAPSGGSGRALLEVVESATLDRPIPVDGEVTLGRRAEAGVVGVGDRYMSGRHARLRVEGSRVWVTDLDSKNRTYLNDEPLPPHQARAAGDGDTLRMGTTVLRVRLQG